MSTFGRYRREGATIGHLDPAVGTRNSGDYIIREAVLREILPHARTIVPLSTRRRWTRRERKLALTCDAFVVGGTNLLTSHPGTYRQWNVSPRDLEVLAGRTLLLGVGWWQYQEPPDVDQQTFLSTVLDSSATHSVRDSYTASQLSFLDMEVVNTGCPTMWGLEHPNSGSFNGLVVTAVTDYARDPDNDSLMLQALISRAEEVVLWAQGRRDLRYVKSLGFSNLSTIDSVSELYETLRLPDSSYCGTRLHAGIAALQCGAASLIIEVDNRAKEIARDTHLATLSRSELVVLDQNLREFRPKPLRLPSAAIADWRVAFRSQMEGH